MDNLAPSKVLNLAGSVVDAKGDHYVSLHWNPSTEADLGHYAMHRDINPGFTPSPGSLVGTSVDTNYTDIVKDGTYYYRVCAVDIHGNVGEGSNEWDTGPLGVAGRPEPLPLMTYLGNARPNPSRGGQVAIIFGLKEPCQGRVAVYNILGGLVRYIKQGQLEAGYYTSYWDGRDEQGREVSAGVYILRMEAGGVAYTRRLAVVR